MAKSNMDQDILKVLYSEEQLKTRVQEMGDELYERRHRARLPAQERH